jgi:hypothetical protein
MIESPEIQISDREWSQLWRLVDVVDPAETGDGGVTLATSAGRRHWSCSNDQMMIRVEGDIDAALDAPIILPARLVAFAAEVSRLHGSCSVHRRVEDGTVVVCTPDALAVADHPVSGPPPITPLEIESATATLTVGALSLLLRHTLQLPTGVDPDAANHIPTVIFTEDGVLGTWVPWRGAGAQTSTIRVVAAIDRDAIATVDLMPLLRICERIGDPDETVTVRVPLNPGGVVRVDGDNWTAAVVAVDESVEAWRPAILQQLDELGCAAHSEPDGSLLIGWHGTTLRVELIDGWIPHIRVRRTLASDIDASESLLAELNELSAGLPGIGLWWKDRAVAAVTDLPCSGLDGLNLAISDLMRQTGDLGRLLGSVAA